MTSRIARAGISAIVKSSFKRLRGQKNLMDAATVFVVRILAAFLAYGVQIFLARSLNLADYGIYVTLWTWLIILNHIAVFGFSETSIRFLPRYINRNKNAWVKGFLISGYKTVALCSALLSMLGILGVYFLSNHIEPAYLIPIAILFVGLPFSALELYLEGVSRSFGWFMLTIVPTYVLRPLLIAAGVLLILYAGYVPDAATVLAIATLVTGFAVIAQTLIIRHRVMKTFGKVQAGGPKKLWHKISLPLILLLAIDEVFLWSDILILGFLAPPEDVSVYFAAQRSMSLAAFVQFAFMMVVARDLSLATANRDKSILQKEVSKASTWTFWLTVPAVLITLIMGYPLLLLFGETFTSGYVVMIILGIGFLLRTIIGQAQDLLIILGHQRTNIIIAIGSIFLNIVLSIILVPSYGIVGVAISTTFTYGIRAIIYSVVTKRLASISVLASLPKLNT